MAEAATATPGAAQSISVGLGELAVTRTDAEPLVARGLGSCIALCLFDPAARVAGLAHVVLPGKDPFDEPNPKFAGSALPALIAALHEVGGAADPRRYEARLAGGAHVLTMGGSASLPRIGDKNLEAVRAALAAACVPVVAEHVGGGRGRTVWFDARDNGRIRVRTIGGAEESI
jgi:chemotaxis protein CheD